MKYKEEILIVYISADKINDEWTKNRIQLQINFEPHIFQ